MSWKIFQFFFRFFFRFFFNFFSKFSKFSNFFLKNFRKFSKIFEIYIIFYELWGNLIKNTPVKTIKMINFVKKIINFDFFLKKISPSGGPPLGKLLKRRAVSDGRLRRGLRAGFFFDFSTDLKSDLRGKVVPTLRIWLQLTSACTTTSALTG